MLLMFELDSVMHSSSDHQSSDVAQAVPEWSTFEGQRRRTFMFLVFSAIYVGYQLIARWVKHPLFDGDWYYFGGEGPPWYEFIYRWFLTLLPLAAWVGVIFFLLTRLRFLTHRRVAFVVVFLGLVFVEGNMRWFNISKNHVSWTEMQAFLDIDGSQDLGLGGAAYEEIAWQFGYHVLFLALCAFLAGPEPRLILRALWNGALGTVVRAIWNGTVGTILQAVWSGPIGTTYFGIGCRWLFSPGPWLRLDLGLFRLLGWLDSKAAFACVAGLVMIDPVAIWALDNGEHNVHGDKAVVRLIADTNPLRMHSLDRAWRRVVFAYSERAQEIAAANQAMRELDSLAPAAKDPPLAIPKRQVPLQPDAVLILQAETLSAEMFSQTDLPFLNEFAKKCVRLKRHFSVANATHYGILGLLHGSPVTFFNGPRPFYRPNPYLDHFKEHGYKTRLITRSVLSHHSLGHYLNNWTEPVSEPDGDFKCIPEIHEQLKQPGPQLIYSFYHATHYPYNHVDQPRYQKHLPEVDYEFNYNRPALVEWKDQIVNRYKNTLLEMDDWYREILEKVDLSKTIVVITGDHGEEFFQQGRLGHCSALNIHQTMTPCLVYIPGVAPTDVTFITSHADIMPTITDALGHQKKPVTLGQSLFEPVAFRYAVLSHFEYTKCMLWAVATHDRMAVFERDYWDNVAITSLTDWNGQAKGYFEEAEDWHDRFRIIRRVEAELRAARE